MIKKAGKGRRRAGQPWLRGGDWRDDMDLENRIVETGYTPEDSEVENRCGPVPFLNILGRIK